MGVLFPSVDDNQLERTVLVGGVSPFATLEALQALFALCGSVRSVQFAGPNRCFSFIEFETEGAALAATRMTGVTLQGQALRVESAATAKQAAATNPFTAFQAHQMQTFQLMQQQQAALAQQVAHLRASQRGTAAAGSQHQGAMAAAAAMARKWEL